MAKILRIPAVNKKRYNRMRKRRSAIPYPRAMGTALRHKTYNYNFALDPQFMVEDTTNPGHIKISGGNAPVFAGTLPSTQASISGIPGAHDLGFSAQFRLSDIQNFAVFTALYDQFKINSVTCVATMLTGTGANFIPSLYAVIDEDSAAPPTAVTDITGMQGFKRMQFTASSKNTFRMSCRPKYTQNASTGDAIIPKTLWMDSATSAGSPGNALKFWLENVELTSLDSSFCIKLQWYYNVSFRQPLQLH